MAPSGPGGLAEEQQVLTDLTDQALCDHFVSLTEHATVWVALKLTGADATADNAKKLWQKLMKRLHPDKCNLPEETRTPGVSAAWTQGLGRARDQASVGRVC